MNEPWLMWRVLKTCVFKKILRISKLGFFGGAFPDVFCQTFRILKYVLLYLVLSGF